MKAKDLKPGIKFFVGTKKVYEVTEIMSITNRHITFRFKRRVPIDKKRRTYTTICGIDRWFVDF